MSYTPIITFDYETFVAQIPAYSNPTTYPEATIQAFWNTAIYYVTNVNNCGGLTNDQRVYAINLMTAHLMYISGLIAGGQVPGLMQSATIDKVNVSLTPPPLRNQWQWWLSVSPYGQQLMGLLQVNSVGGYYTGSPYGGLQGFKPVRGLGFGYGYY
jgi:hypothetical protein